MADSSQGVTYAQLAWTQAWYLSEETYAAALACIVDAQSALPHKPGVGRRNDVQLRRAVLPQRAARSRRRDQRQVRRRPPARRSTPTSPTSMSRSTAS